MLGNGGRYIEIVEHGEDLGEAFRADAKAEGQSVVVGGWESRGGVQPRMARWFAVTLTRANAAWAFSKGEPFRTIASLELFGTLLCVMIFSSAWRTSSTGRIRVTGATDNRGNSQALPRLMSSKFPLVVILAELAAQMRRSNLRLELDWVPRDQNEPADDLTNSEYGRFDMARRIEVDLAKLEFVVLSDYMKVAQHVYGEVTEQRQKAKDSKETKDQPYRKKPKLRETAPW